MPRLGGRKRALVWLLADVRGPAPRRAGTAVGALAACAAVCVAVIAAVMASRDVTA